MSEPLGWHDPEWWSLADFASGMYPYDEVYAAEDAEFFTECSVTHHPDEGWYWMVKATSNLSEWPEVQNSGSCATLVEGKRRCQETVDKILAGNPQRKTY